MSEAQTIKGKVFKELHSADGIFVMPNAWNAGSACMLEAAGFPAVGTTSAGISFCLGLPDSEGLLTREAAMEETGRIVGAIRIPVSVDAENGYGHTPEEVAETIRQVADTGAVGASIEDYAAAYGTGDLYDRVLSVERIEAAVAVANSLPFPFTLTARAECYLMGHPNPFEESVTRVNLYREAGADCLFVPGIKDVETIGRLVKEVDGPINVVMGLAGNPMSVKQLEYLGVKRVSIGGSLARTTFGVIRRAAEEIRVHGTFTYSEGQVPDAELCRFFCRAAGIIRFIANHEYYLQLGLIRSTIRYPFGMRRFEKRGASGLIRRVVDHQTLKKPVDAPVAVLERCFPMLRIQHNMRCRC